MTVADLLQLLPVRGKLLFSQFCNKDNTKHLLGLQLWHLFKYAELTVFSKMINCLLTCAKNELAMKRDESGLNNLPGEL